MSKTMLYISSIVLLLAGCNSIGTMPQETERDFGLKSRSYASGLEAPKSFLSLHTSRLKGYYILMDTTNGKPYISRTSGDTVFLGLYEGFEWANNAARFNSSAEETFTPIPINKETVRRYLPIRRQKK